MSIKKSLKERAVNMRKKGWSYRDITESLHVPKSTLSAWFRDVPFSPNRTVLKRMNEALQKSIIVRQARKRASIDRALQEASITIGNLSERDLLVLGLGLYIGEGMKSCELTRFSNADPQVIKCIMRWFREILSVPEKCFRARIHLYPDNDRETCLRYWSKITKISQAQFGKVSVDRRQKTSEKRKSLLPYGTIHITVIGAGDPKFASQFHRYIMGMIKKVID